MAELADAADSKSAGLRPLGVRLPLPAPWSNPFRKQLVNSRGDWCRNGVTISLFACDSAQTLTKLLFCRFQPYSRFGVVPLLPGFELCHCIANVGLRNDCVALEHASSFPAADLHDDPFGDSSTAQVPRCSSQRRPRGKRPACSWIERWEIPYSDMGSMLVMCDEIAFGLVCHRVDPLLPSAWSWMYRG